MVSKYKTKKIGSYVVEDAVFLLKDISGDITETATEDREENMQGGGHYSEMLPIEYEPSDEYLDLFHESLKESADKIAKATAVVSEEILRRKGTNVILVSLARAGTPFGILIKRYIEKKYSHKLPHYSISIIRGKGIDENALKYIIANHGNNIQFIDGWTGKGAINGVLKEACSNFEKKYGTSIDSTLAVIADPGYCSEIYGTREDFLLPSACLNATVSGLISRTVHRNDLINETDFHGVKVYNELMEKDLSNHFIDAVSKEFDKIILVDDESQMTLPNFLGQKDLKTLQELYDIKDINMIKPGIGETTRVLLRRLPWKILVRDLKSDKIKHILVLAKEKNVTVEEYNFLSYECCGIIKSIK